MISAPRRSTLARPADGHLSGRQAAADARWPPTPAWARVLDTSGPDGGRFRTRRTVNPPITSLQLPLLFLKAGPAGARRRRPHSAPQTKRSQRRCAERAKSGSPEWKDDVAMDTATVVFNLAAIAFSLLAIASSAATALRQSRLMEYSNLLPVVVDLFDRYRAPEFKRHLEQVATQLWDKYPPETTRFNDLPQEVRSHASSVVTFFNLVGILVANGIVSDLIVASYMRVPIVRAWAQLGPYIRNERRYRQDDWYPFFEHLAYIMSQYSTEKINARLKLKRMPIAPIDVDGDTD